MAETAMQRSEIFRRFVARAQARAHTMCWSFLSAIASLLRRR